MCGIFAVFHLLDPSMFSTVYPSVDKHFNAAQSRGPEFSTLQHITENVLFGFHRLAINGLDEISNQPICIDGVYLICNGEIYNYKSIYKLLNVTPSTNSDCESIIHLYKRYGIEYTLQNLDGVFSFVLYDSNTNVAYIARDPLGVRPLYYGRNRDGTIVFSSLLKQISGLCTDCSNFAAGSYIRFSIKKDKFDFSTPQMSYTSFNYNHNIIGYSGVTEYNNAYKTIYDTLVEAVRKRVITMERNMACLLSGGLDSSLISAIVSKFVPKGQLQTYSIGMVGGSDLKYAKMVSNHIHSNHTEIVMTEHEFFSAIPEVIYNIESYDTTTVRASVGNYLVAKYIAEHSDAKVIFNGDGSDELTGGYLYFHNCSSDIEFDYECKRLLSNLQHYDLLRSDRSISCHGLEPRTPFLDRTFVHTYLSMPIHMRNHNNENNMEKHLLRKSVAVMDHNLLPSEVLWRTKEAFSDGVSSQENSWYEIIQSKLNDRYSDQQLEENKLLYLINPPSTKEQLYYRELFETFFPNRGKIIPKFWMPKYSNVTDASARKLDIYKKKNSHTAPSNTETANKLTIDTTM